jgi:hypothetical protein
LIVRRGRVNDDIHTAFVFAQWVRAAATTLATLLARGDYCAAASLNAAIPARAIAASCSDFTPDTPIEPTTSPLTMIGTPPSTIATSGALRNAVRPCLMMSS